MAREWTIDDVMTLCTAFQKSCILTAAADLDLFSTIAAGATTAQAVAGELGTDLRATTMLLDALAAIELLVKEGEAYRLAPGVAEALTESSPANVLPMARHLGVCLRNWARLGEVVLTGKRAERIPSIRGEGGDLASFIAAMHRISEDMAPGLVAALGPPPFRHLLDVGGGSGTWTTAFLRARPEATATLFDLPPVIPMARSRLDREGFLDRVTLVGGDMDADPLPEGADLAWVSAIIHMNSPYENRLLFRKIHRALAPGGRVLIRDMVMDPTRTRPVSGALFAINMLVNTPGGGTFTLDEIRSWLEETGFRDVELLHQGEGMDAVVSARKP